MRRKVFLFIDTAPDSGRCKKFFAPFTNFTIFSLVAVLASADVRPDAGAGVLARHHADRSALVGLGISLVVLAAMRHFSAKQR